MTNPYDHQEGGDHYKGMAIQPMQFSMANGLDACTHNTIKYLVRRKGDKAKRAEDLRKAIHCIHLLAAHEGIELGEAAQPAVGPLTAADADGWIKWDGGGCPVAYGTPIDVEYRSGERAVGLGALVPKVLGRTATHWTHIGCGGDIIAYRLSKEASQ